MYHKDNTLPENGEIFVFGSNLAGIHGAGAALAAKRLGAIQGQGYGPQGQTYAIPTKDSRLTTLSITRIRVHVADFLRYAKENSELYFYITRIGCGLAGYKDSQIAPLFKRLPNCSYPIQWKQYLPKE